jgi:uncharacterized membrane protein
LWILEFLKSLPKELAVFIAAATPIIEVRGSIPLGFGLGLNPVKIFLISVIGSLIPVIPILWFLNFLTDDLRKIKLLDRFFEWLFKRTRSRSELIEKYETAGLALFVAIPLPVTGVWTGCVAAYLFGLSWMQTIAAVALGTILASTIVTVIFTVGAAGIISLLRL